MTGKIFRNALVAVIISVLLCVVVLLSVLFEYFSLKIEHETEGLVYFVMSVAENGGIDELAVPENKRVYIVDTNGMVLYDSGNEAQGSLYAGAEFEEAIERGEGKFEGKAYGPSERVVRYAKKLENGNVICVETAKPTLQLIAFGISGIVLTVTAIAALLVFAGAVRTSKQISKPLNAIEPDSTSRLNGFDELKPLFGKIERQNKMIQKQVEELGRQRKEFNDIIDNMNEGLLIIDDKKRILSANTAALRLLHAEMPKFGTGVFSLNQGEDFYDAVDEALAGESSVKNISAGESYCQIITTPVVTEEVVTGAVMVIIDITEREKLEVMRREFTSNVSHELKTPLTSIYGLSEILMSGGVEEEIVKDFSKSIHDETGRMISLVNDILKLSQLDEGGLNYRREYVDLLELSCSVVERLKMTAQKAEVTISVCGENVKVFGVYKVIEEIVYNLCDNSLKYNKPDGSVQVTVGRDDGRAFVTVADTGIGIPEEALPRIFERFYRVDKSHSKKIGGTGLGLSIVKHAAAMHGAEITAESKIGEGTSITVRF